MSSSYSRVVWFLPQHDYDNNNESNKDIENIIIIVIKITYVSDEESKKI